VHTFESEGKVDGERMGFRDFFLLMVGSPTLVVLLLKVKYIVLVLHATTFPHYIVHAHLPFSLPSTHPSRCLFLPVLNIRLSTLLIYLSNNRDWQN